MNVVAGGHTFGSSAWPAGDDRIPRPRRVGTANGQGNRNMTTNGPIHTLPAGDGWEIREEGSTTALSKHSTRDDAIAAGRRRAKADGVEHFIHNPRRSSSRRRTSSSSAFGPIRPHRRHP
ncbi:MAG: DUF2188 domain-containing protein [Acidimicrobiia bacterium]|nr:DUF2188 domain-containing protein [Acidimicrobiia bacterium]